MGIAGRTAPISSCRCRLNTEEGGLCQTPKAARSLRTRQLCPPVRPRKLGHLRALSAELEQKLPFRFAGGTAQGRWSLMCRIWG